MYDKLTPNDIKKIEEELAYRRGPLFKQLNDAVKEARAQGDLSENFEYYAARKEKGRNDSRVRYLENVLRTATVLEEPKEEGVIGVNSMVEIFMENRNKKQLIKIVTTIRANSRKGYISIESPFGKAVLGHKEGDRVYINVNETNGYYVQIISIDNTIDDEDDEINAY